MGMGNRKGDGLTGQVTGNRKGDGLTGKGNILLFGGLVYLSPQPGAELGVCAVERAVRPVVVAETLRQVGKRLEVRRQQRLQVGLRESGHRRGGHRRRLVGGGLQDRARHPGVVGRQPFDDPLGRRQVLGVELYGLLVLLDGSTPVSLNNARISLDRIIYLLISDWTELITSWPLIGPISR